MHLILLILLLLLPSVTQNLSTAPLPTSLHQAILWDSRGVLPAVIILPVSHGDAVVHGDVVSHGDVVVHRAPVLSTIRPVRPVRPPGVKLSALPNHCPSHFYPHVQRLHLRARAGTRARNQRLVVVLWGRSRCSSKHRPETFLRLLL